MNRRNEIRNFFYNFCKCGVAGWCIEIVFTSFESIAARDMRLMGRTSILMFPIYGMGALLGPISRGIDRWIGEAKTLTRRDKFWRHGLNDMVLIFCAEYLSGRFLKARGMCPWDYSGRPLNIDGLIRLDFAPCWFAVGLLFERITMRKREEREQENVREKE